MPALPGHDLVLEDDHVDHGYRTDTDGSVCVEMVARTAW
jgi:hypothetical protein